MYKHSPFRKSHGNSDPIPLALIPKTHMSSIVWSCLFHKENLTPTGNSWKTRAGSWYLSVQRHIKHGLSCSSTVNPIFHFELCWPWSTILNHSLSTYDIKGVSNPKLEHTYRNTPIFQNQQELCKVVSEVVSSPLENCQPRRFLSFRLRRSSSNPKPTNACVQCQANK